MDYELTIFDSESAPQYIALSYTWGKGSATESITVGGKAFRIRPNLFKFLQTYQSHTDVYIWVDQICIDQSNIQERNHQVKLMSKVYRRCKYVQIWLRDDTTFTPSTRQAALDFNRGIYSYTNHDARGRSSGEDKTCLDSSILALLHNPYFDRLWITQEVLLSKHVQVLVEGNVVVSWDALREKQWNLTGFQNMWKSRSSILTTHYIRFAFADHTPRNLAYYITQNVVNFRGKMCENPRDQVYGFMALVAPSSQVTIDYGKSVQRVYLDALMVMISEYLYMRHDTPEKGYELFRPKWSLEFSRNATWQLAQNMGFTDLQNSGLKSFLDGVWKKVVQYDIKHGLLTNAETHCITSFDFEPETPRVLENGRLVVVPSRWCYVYEGLRFYHDSKERSGDSELREYTEPDAGIRLYSS